MRKILLIFLGILLVGTFVSAETSYCCEKTDAGAWCQNAPEASCDAGTNCGKDSQGNPLKCRSTPTSCESTSYCKLGTCIDSSEGTCMENTPQKVCEDETGVWYDEDADDIPQCGLGCCLVGDQAAFVTQTRCKRLSAIYGLETNFRTDISSEVQCIASTTSAVKGACVFEKEFEPTCLFVSQKDCSEVTGNVSFHEGYLCSDETLGTNCGPSKKTTCVEGRDEVFFVDTCGNLANVYDSAKIDDKEYWSRVKENFESCGYGSSNADSASCGNCDYYLGSTCKNYNSGQDKSSPKYGDNICRDLSCEYEGKKYEHGETWCAKQKGIENSLPGSRGFRMVCYNDEVSVEPCADFRQEICIEDSIEDFSTAACRVNQWQDCVSQGNAKDCHNEDRRDCKWINEGCVPKFAPGFNFWDSEGDAEEICSQANAKCIVTYEKSLGGEKECIGGCECISDSWESEKNEMCVALGDCGSTTNYIGVKGYNDGKAVYSGTGGNGESSEGNSGSSTESS